MIITERTLTLRDGRTAVLRSPREADIPSLLELLRNVTEETDFLMRYPEETCEYTPELEQIFIENINGHAHNAMALCVVDGRVVGSCTISTSQRIKLRHRAGIGISVLRDFWGQGIGTALMEAVIDAARENPNLLQIELEFLEGNTRARQLYEKLGFRIVSVHPNAIQRKDGTLCHEYLMVKELKRA